MQSAQRHFIRLFLATTILAPTTCKAQFNEEQVAIRYAVLRDSLGRADSLLAAGDRASALAIYKATTLWKHKAGWRFVRQLKCTAGPGGASEAALDSLAHYGYTSKAVERDSLLRAILGSKFSSGAYPSIQHTSPLKQVVDSLGDLDQQVRNLPASDGNDRLIGKTDSTNIDLLYTAFREHGGYIPSMGSILILTHALSLKPDHLDYFAQAIGDALLDQDLDSYTYGAIVDEFHWHTRNCQVFGTIRPPDDPDVPALRWCDPERTVRLRKLLGLPATTE